MNRSFFAFAAMSLLAACGTEKNAPTSPPELNVNDAVIRLAAVEGRPSAAYFTIHGGKAPDRLESISSPSVATIELHESKMQGGMMSMRPLTGVDVPAGGTVAFKPGGNHAMLFGVDPSVKPGGSVTLSFAFQNGKKIDVAAKAIAAGDEMPMTEHEGH